MLNYAVEYRGLKTKEEKGMEQIVSVLITVFFFGFRVWLLWFHFANSLEM
jgi:hypothetical protein